MRLNLPHFRLLVSAILFLSDDKNVAVVRALYLCHWVARPYNNTRIGFV